MANSKAVFNNLKSQLINVDPDEAHAIGLLLMEKFCGVSLTGILAEKEIEPFDFSSLVERINSHEPIQYILGEADFFGRKFAVNRHTLIPRPETELIIHEVLRTKIKEPVILDVGTGSGCIAISLAKEIPGATISAVDISTGALEVAKENARKHHASLTFISSDFLKTDLDVEPLDWIVSNPPYVRELEKKAMERNVLNFEPHNALFVPDNDPLLFYKAIATKGKTLLKPSGKIAVEINAQFGPEVKKLFDDLGFIKTKIIKDLDGKDRIVCAERPA
jgi:release factor glutamine methyltransferase